MKIRGGKGDVGDGEDVIPDFELLAHLHFQSFQDPLFDYQPVFKSLVKVASGPERYFAEIGIADLDRL